MAVPDPTTIAVRNEGNGVIRLTLALISDATSYKVYREETPAPAVQISSVTTAISNDNNGIAEDTVYYYRVKASNADGDSAYSNEVSIASGEWGRTSHPTRALQKVRTGQFDVGGI
jgi:hypothetical protein